MSEFKKQEELIKRLLAINLLLKVIQSSIISVNSCKQKMIEIENKNEKNKNKDRWDYCHHFPILPSLGANHCLPLLHMAKFFIWINETSERINEFAIVYMINPTFHVNKGFEEKVEKMYE